MKTKKNIELLQSVTITTNLNTCFQLPLNWF